jgi:ABC-type uncharacterized transport system fused permease/ATPase subunit
MQQPMEIPKIQLFKRYVRAASGFWKGETGWMAWSLFFLLIALILFQLLVSYLINYWNRDFFNALSSKDAHEIKKIGLLFIPLAISNVLIAILNVWAKMRVQMKWREWLSNYMIDYWLKNDHYRKLTVMKNLARNAEFRIAEDGRVATDHPLELFLGLFSSTITAITFIGILWDVGGTLDFNAFGDSYSIPGYLVYVALLYSVILTSSTVIFARFLTASVEEKNSSEAELRATASLLRVHGERGIELDHKKEESNTLKKNLTKVIHSWKNLCFQLMRTTLVSSGNGVLAPVMGLLFCAPKYIGGGMTIGAVVQAAAAFVTVQSCFNWLLNNYPSIADWLSSSNRVGFLLYSLDDIEQKEKSQHHSTS